MAQADQRLFTVAFVALTVSDLAYFTAAGLVMGVTPFFVTGPLGAGTAGLGVALGAFSVTTLVLRPVVGRMVDESGRRRLLLAGACLFAVMIAAHLLVEQLWALIVVRLVLGVAEAMYFVAGFATLSDLAPPGRAGEALSWNSVALYLGIAAGPGIGQLLMDWRGYGAAWVGGAALALVAALLVLRVPETWRPAPEDAAPAPLIHPAVVRPGLALLAGVAATAGFLALVGLHASEVGFRAWSVVPLVYGGIVVGCRIVFARVPDRLPPLRLGAASLSACALGLLVLAGIPTPVGVLVGAAVLGFGVAFLTPAIFAAILGVVPAHERGGAAGTATLFMDLGFGGGPLLLGLIAAGAGIPVAFASAAALSALAAPVLLASAGPIRQGDRNED
ncbi:MAG TPA: MFS transporter [Propionibacteriaceae bacterium]|nr:MFS transporter [Propionibacteriaceae bacterium]